MSYTQNIIITNKREDFDDENVVEVADRSYGPSQKTHIFKKHEI